MRFILLGLALAAPGEVLNQVLARQSTAAFRATMTSYAVLLLAGFFVGRGLRAFVCCRRRAMVLYYLFFGSLGLAVEWCLLGNRPVLDPLQLVTQPGMFTYWGTMLLGPWLLTECGPFARLKRSFVIFYISYSCVYLLVASLIPRNYGGLFFGFIIFAAGTAALNYFHIWYFRLLAPAPAQAPVPA